jgi:DNA-binding LacI/PurR family transcriptional regulator
VRAEPVTIRTVAERAGVSTTTASDAMRGSGRVSERTRARVLEVAESLRYVPNGSAQHLRRASTGAIGLHLPAVLTRSNYYMSFVFGVVERAAADSYDVTLLTSGQPESRRTPRVDGLVLGDPLAGDPVVERLMAAGVPTVTCERFPGDARASRASGSPATRARRASSGRNTRRPSVSCSTTWWCPARSDRH